MRQLVASAVDWRVLQIRERAAGSGPASPSRTGSTKTTRRYSPAVEKRTARTGQPAVFTDRPVPGSVPPSHSPS